MKSSTITAKGQILIPVRLRRKYGLHSGSKVIISDDNQSIRVVPLTAKSIRTLAGILKGGKDTTKTLLEARRKDRERNK